MSENDDHDPGASTQQFQAFVDRREPEASGPRLMRGVLAGAALAGLVVVVALAWFLLGS